MQTEFNRVGRWFWRPLGVAAIVAAALVASGAVPRMSATTPAATAPAAVTSTAPPVVTSYADTVSKAAPAVVTVRIERKAEASPSVFQFQDDPFFQRFFGPGQQGRMRSAPPAIERGVGSGVIISPDGNILTNNHVVGGAEHVTVNLSDGREFSAKVLGTDPATDLAVVHIDATDLPTLPLGDSDRVRVGDVVLAIGNPLDVGQTVTMGIISAKGRTTGNGDSYEDFLQTDAPINQGNSGGALITAAGELVGINSQIVSNSGGSIGIGFAIPSNMAKNVAHQLVATGQVRRAIIGVTVQSVTSDLAKSLRLSDVHGALVSSVTEGGPAAKAGVQQSDVIVKLNGQDVEDSNQLRNHVSALSPGTTVTLDLIRQGSPRQVSVTLGELPATDRADAGQPSKDDDLGMTLAPMSPMVARQFQIPTTVRGVAVTDLDPAGAAARAGIRPGDVVRQINGQAVTTPEDLRAALAKAKDRPALAYVQRGDQSLYLALPTDNS
jgi:Do/DeqQ family serine protease